MTDFDELCKALTVERFTRHKRVDERPAVIHSTAILVAAEAGNDAAGGDVIDIAERRGA